MSRTWIVVADHTRARFYTVETARGPLIELQRLEHPPARLRAGELGSDRPGRAFDSVGTGRHAMQPEVDPKEQEATRFAKKIAGELDKGRTEGRFNRLLLVAEPHFLGLLRQRLGPSVTQLVRDEIAKNLTQYDAREVRAHLPETL